MIDSQSLVVFLQPALVTPAGQRIEAHLFTQTRPDSDPRLTFLTSVQRGIIMFDGQGGADAELPKMFPVYKTNHVCFCFARLEKDFN